MLPALLALRLPATWVIHFNAGYQAIYRRPALVLLSNTQKRRWGGV